MQENEMIARIEAAEGSFDTLELELARWCYANGGIAGINYDPRLWIERHCWEPLRSIDQAAALVPDGHEWIRKSSRSMTVYKVPPDDKTWALHHDAAGYTPAAALTAAALRARAAIRATPPKPDRLNEEGA